MSLTTNFVMLTVGIVLIMGIFGLFDTSTSKLFELINPNNLENFKASSLFDIIFNTTTGLFALGGLATGLVVGYLITQSPETAIISGFVISLGTWVIGDLASIYVQMNTKLTGEFAFLSSAILIFTAIYIFGFIMAIINYWRGSD